MKKQYTDLNLKSIREALNIDFAHFTYPKNMCSCCYGPKDLPKIYRKDGIEAEDIKTYILFKNAENGSGTVTKYDTIGHVNISWNLTDEQLEGVCDMLQEQLGSSYKVIKPEDSSTCITIEKIE